MKKVLAIIVSMIIISSGIYWITYNTSEYEKKWGWLPTTSFIPLWERKVDTQQVLKLGLITDTHVHPNRINRKDKSDEAPRHFGSSRDAGPLRLFNEQMKKFQPDAIVHAGDVIEGTGDEDFVGIMGLNLMQKELEKSGVPVHWAIGNHDLRSVNKEQFSKTLEISGTDKVIDYADYRLIMLDANYYPDGRDIEPGGKRHIPGYIHPDTFAWIEQKLDTDKHVYIFMHHGAFDVGVQQGESVDASTVIGRAKDEKQREKLTDNRDKTKWSVTNVKDFRTMMEKYNVDVFVNGHLEVARYGEINGVKYYSLAGTKKSKIFPESFYEMTITASIPDVMMYYTDPIDQTAQKAEFEETYIPR